MSFSLFLPRQAIAARDKPEDVTVMFIKRTIENFSCCDEADLSWSFCHVV